MTALYDPDRAVKTAWRDGAIAGLLFGFLFGAAVVCVVMRAAGL